MLTELLVSLPEVEARRAMREEIKSEGFCQLGLKRQRIEEKQELIV